MMKLVDILYENTQSNDKFVNLLIPKLTHWYDNLYPDTDWFNAAYNVVNSQKGPYEYWAAASNANIQMEELNKLISSAGSMLNMDIDQLISFRKKYQTQIKSVNDNINLLVHLRDMFTSMRQGNFMEIYSVPIGVMIELWTRWIKEVYEPESEKREMSYGGKNLVPIRNMGDGIHADDWEKINPDFGQQDFWKWFSTMGMGEQYYVTSSYLEDVRGKEPLMFDAKDKEEMLTFIDNVEMEMAIDELSQYFTTVGARKVIKYLRGLGKQAFIHDDIDDVEKEIGLQIKTFIDHHPEIDFDTDGESDQTFTRIGEILNDYLHY